MGIGTSIVLIAVGAILTWAVNVTVQGLDINTVGVILMLVGALGLILSAVYWNSWGGFRSTRRTTVYAEGDPAYDRAPRRRREVVRDEEIV